MPSAASGSGGGQPGGPLPSPDVMAYERRLKQLHESEAEERRLAESARDPDERASHTATANSWQLLAEHLTEMLGREAGRWRRNAGNRK